MSLYTIVKTIKTTTYGRGFTLTKVVVNEDCTELRRLASMDEAIDYVKAYMINDLHEYRICPLLPDYSCSDGCRLRS